MPIEIRELVIKATLGEGTKNTGNDSSNQSEQSTPANQETIVKACVEKVLEILKQKQER